MALTDTLKEQVGPLPLGVWVAVVGGALGFSFYTRRHPHAAAGVADAAGIDTRTGTAATAGNLSGPIGTPQQGQTAGPPIRTNEEWRVAVITTLLGHGYLPLLVERAVDDYLAGNRLDSAEAAVIDAALRYVGPVPLAPGPLLIDPGAVLAGPGNPPSTVQRPHPPKRHPADLAPGTSAGRPPSAWTGDPHGPARFR